MSYLRKLKIYHLLNIKPSNDNIFDELIKFSENIFQDITVYEIINGYYNGDYIFKNKNSDIIFYLEKKLNMNEKYDFNIIQKLVKNILNLFNFNETEEILKYLIYRKYKIKNIEICIYIRETIFYKYAFKNIKELDF